MDAKGPRILLVIGFVFLLSGYLGIRHLYDVGLPEGVADLSTVAFGALVLCGFMTGIGGNGGLASSMNVTAKSWPDRAVRALFPYSIWTICDLGKTESNYDWSRIVRIRSLSLPVLNPRTYILPGRHFRVPASPSDRYFVPYGLGLLLRPTYPFASL